MDRFSKAAWRLLGSPRRHVVLGALWCAGLCSGALAQSKFEGDVAHKADVARLNYSVDGSGVKVCVVSFNSEKVDLTKVTVVSGLDGPTNPALDGEGAAMLQIINRLAPGATLAFASGSPVPPAVDAVAATETAFRKLREAGCKIIVDDLTNGADSPFHKQTVEKEIDTAVAQGIVVISAAGNFGNAAGGTSQSWEGDFLDMGVRLPGGQQQAHRFTSPWTIAQGAYNYVYPTDPSVNDAAQACPPSDVLNPDGTHREGALATLTWNDPPGQATNDYDLVLYDIARAEKPYAVGTTPADQQGNPIKSAPVRPNTAIAIFKKSRAEPRYLHLEVKGSCGRLQIYTDGSTKGHNAAENVISVGAVSAAGRTTPFDETAKVEAKSSDGPRRVYFNGDGEAYTADLTAQGGKKLLKPDFAAASVVTTDVPLTQYQPFSGTSAAAPHVAGIAALILSYSSLLTPAQVRQVLIDSAIDIEGPGWDSLSGYGIPMADKALQQASIRKVNFRNLPATRHATVTLGSGALQDEDGLSLGVSLQLVNGHWPQPPPGNAYADVQFDVAQVPASGMNVVMRHRTSPLPMRGPQDYANITITLNNSVIASRYDVARAHNGSFDFVTDQFLLPAASLRAGANTLRVRYLDEADPMGNYSMDWLRIE